MKNVLEIEAVSKAYKKNIVLDQLSFTVQEGSFFALLGLMLV